MLARSLCFQIVLILSFVLPQSVWAQQWDVSDQPFHHYTVQDGLSQSTVRTIIQDGNGFIWMGTTNGLNRFNGHSFTEFSISRFSKNSLSNQWINYLAEDSTGHIWIGTNGGLNVYDPFSGIFEHIEDSTGEFLSDGKIISLHVQGDSLLWIGTFEGPACLRLSDRSFVTLSIGDKAKAIGSTLVHEFMETDGDIWFATDAGVFRKRDEDPYIERLEASNRNEISGTEPIKVRTMATDSNGKVWAGTRYHGVFYLDDTQENSFRFVPIAANDIMLTDHVTDIAFDAGNNLWIGSRNGLYVYHPEEQSTEMYARWKQEKFGFQDEMVMRLFIDRHQNLWVASQATGAYVTNLKPRLFNLIPDIRLSNTENASGEIWALQNVDSTLWVGSHNGLSSISYPYSSKSLRTHYLSGKNILSINPTSDGTLWLGIFGEGIGAFDTKTEKFTIYHNGESFDRRILVTHQLGDSLLLVGTFENLYTFRFRDKEFEIIPIFEDLSSPPLIYSLENDDNNRFWIGTNDGVYEWDSAEKKSRKLELTIPESVNDITNEINAMHYQKDKGRLWIATNYGLIGWDEKTQEVHYWDKRDGLTSNMILGMVEDRSEEALWLSTTRGITGVFYADSPGWVKDIRSFEQLDPFNINEFNVGAYFGDHNGIIYFGGVAGVTYFKPDSWFQNQSDAEMSFAEAHIRSETKNRRVALFEKSELILYPGEEDVKIDFVYDDIAGPASQVYAYRLKDNDENWMRISGEPSILLSSLSAGLHTLQLRIVLPDGSLSEAGISLNLDVKPQFWETFWFRILLVITILTLLGIVMRLRIKRLETTNIELEEKVKSRTTELRDTNEKLTHSEELFRSITENVADLVVMCKPDGEIIYANPSAPNIIGYRSDELVGGYLQDWIHPDDHEMVRKQTLQLFKYNQLVFDVYSIFHKDGSERKFVTSGSGIRDEEGRVSFVVSVSHDVTEQMKIQELTRQARESAEAANRAKSDFLANISHELRTPLNAILGYARLLYEDITLGDKQKNFAETMYKSGDHLLVMINEILDLSKIESGRMEVDRVSFNLANLLKDVARIFKLKAERKNLELNLEIQGHLPNTVTGDESKVRQIMMNLIGNALKFTQHGSVDIRCSVVNRDADRIMVLLEVEDTGVGIPEEQQRHVLEPFRQVKGRFNTGTGLGLALTQKFAELLSGSLELESAEGEGTKATVRIALLADDDANIRKYKRGRLPAGIASDKNPSILIIDDIETNARLLKDLLVPVGFKCRTASNGIDGLRLALEEQPDIILLDLRMPGMSGEEVLDEIRKTKSKEELPVIAITASGFHETRKEMLELGFNEFMFKPVDAPDLFDAIGENLSLSYQYNEEDEMDDDEKSDSSDDITEIVNDILSLSPDHRDGFREALELLDFNKLESLSNAQILPEKSAGKMKNIVIDQNFKKLLQIQEQLSGG